MSSGFENIPDIGTWIERFCYWQGEAGQRYLFTRINLEDLPGFSNCVLILASDNHKAGPELHWVGQMETLTPQMLDELTNSGHGKLTAYIHFLAGTSEERASIVMDLTGQTGKRNWTLSA